jgi:hypothetical protein
MVESAKRRLSARLDRIIEEEGLVQRSLFKKKKIPSVSIKELVIEA